MAVGYGAVLGGVFACATSALLPVVAPQIGPIKFWGVLENYYLSTSKTGGAVNRLSWAEITAELNPAWSMTTSYLDVPMPNGTVKRTLDEAFLRYTGPEFMVRAGRFRSPFGFNSWSDYFYDPIIMGPLLRGSKMTPNLGISRMDTGVEVTAGTPNLQLQIAAVDVANDKWQVASERPDHIVARAQTYTGDLVLGISGTTKLGPNYDDSLMAGLDLRWTSPRFIVRGECARGIGKGANGSGYILELFYRPPGLARTQFGIRTEGVKPLAGPAARLDTIGVRQVLTQSFALTINHGWGNGVGAASARQGWTAQLTTSIRF